jgi:hypothetical protein
MMESVMKYLIRAINLANRFKPPISDQFLLVDYRAIGQSNRTDLHQVNRYQIVVNEDIR